MFDYNERDLDSLHEQNVKFFLEEENKLASMQRSLDYQVEHLSQRIRHYCQGHSTGKLNQVISDLDAERQKFHQTLGQRQELLTEAKHKEEQQYQQLNELLNNL